MKSRSFVVVTLSVTLCATIVIALLSQPVQAQNSNRPISASDFHQAAPRGFGDRNNSWPQAMVWWHDALYVGTARQSTCTSLFSLWQFVALLLGQSFADTFFTYPPPDPDLSCAADGADLSLQAEIWRWTPGSEWMRVFQSPLDLDHPGPGAPLPPPIGKKLPYEISFRGLAPHTEPDGVEALYAFGVNSTVMWDRTQLPPPRILRSTDGLGFAPIPQTPGTFLGDLPFNPDHSSFRSPASFGGNLFVLAGPIFGQGSLIGSANPAAGDDAWFLASPPGMIFYEMAAFNGWLYLSTVNGVNGYAIVKTMAEGPPPYQFVTVVPAGAYLPLASRPSRSAVSMQVSSGRLYVGTGTQTEIIRINPDDTWDLVIGAPREVPLTGGGSEWKYPLSGLDAGFGHTLNDHAWQMEDPYRNLYVGTFNASTATRLHPVFGPLLEHNMGAHLYRTPDGWYFSAITTNGFSDPSDPFGGRFDFGIRTMASTPHGAFFGTTNDYYGLGIFRAKVEGDSAPLPPDRLEIEPTSSARALLSWGTSRAQRYEIWRAEINPILVRDDPSFEGWNGASGNKIPDTYIGPYTQIGVSTTLDFTDTTVESGKRYIYYITGVHQDRVSDQSNLVTFPLLTPPMTFSRLLHEVDVLEQRQRFLDPVTQIPILRAMITRAQELAASCRIKQASDTLKFQKVSDYVVQPEAIDLEVLMSKLERRLTLFQQFPTEVISSEFCTV